MAGLFHDACIAMKEHGHSTNSVIFVSHKRGHCSWEEFREAMESHHGDYLNYDKSHEEFAIVGDSWMLTFKHNYSDEYYSEWTHLSLARPESHVIPNSSDFIDKYPRIS